MNEDKFISDFKLYASLEGCSEFQFNPNNKFSFVKYSICGPVDVSGKYSIKSRKLGGFNYSAELNYNGHKVKTVTCHTPTSFLNAILDVIHQIY